MTYIITKDCTTCGFCLGECPVGAIVYEGDIYKIEEDLCTDCGSCETVCPCDAIKLKIPMTP